VPLIQHNVDTACLAAAAAVHQLYINISQTKYGGSGHLGFSRLANFSYIKFGSNISFSFCDRLIFILDVRLITTYTLTANSIIMTWP